MDGGGGGGDATCSQLHSPVAFLPQEHLTPWEEAVEVLCVVKSTGRADMIQYGEDEE